MLRVRDAAFLLMIKVTHRPVEYLNRRKSDT